MKLSAILLLVTSLHVAARSTAQKVTYSGKAVELPKVLSVIREQTGYVFFYDKKYLQDISPITVSLKDAPVELALKTILQGLPLDFEIQGNTIFIHRKSAAIIMDAPEEPKAVLEDTIRGSVRDSAGLPLQGASVLIKGTKKGTRTDLKGGFVLKRSGQMAVLVISYTGYEDREVSVAGEAPLFIFLQRSQNPLDASVVQAYGTTSRRYNVGSISTITAEIIEKQPVTNVLLAIQGQAPGLAVNATSGIPGSKVMVQLRGQNTIQNTSTFFRPYDQPLFIIDGVPFATQNNNINQLSSLVSGSSFNGGISQPGGISPFNGLNPADIESISVLKDADATSIYGTQGSNGVILITTKKGKAGKDGKTDLNISVNTGFNSSARHVKLMNTQQYVQMRKDAFAADGVTPNLSPYSSGYAPDLLVFDQNSYTDWRKVLLGKTSNNTDVHASLSGGGYQNTFLISGGYTRSNFNFPGDFSDERLSLHTATHHSSLDNRLSVDFGTDYSYDKNNGAGGGISKMLNPPNTPALLDAAGNIAWTYKGIDLTNYQFYNFLKQPVNVQVNNLNTSLHLNYKLLPGLSISASLGYNRNTTSETRQNPASSQNPLYASRTASFAGATAQTLNVEPQIDYNNTIGKGVFSALVGASYKKNLSNSNSIEGVGYADDNFLGSLVGASSVYAYDNSSIYKYAAAFARLRYVYDRKYILSLTGRRDGSSNFGPGHQFGDFGSVGAGWIFSEEKAFTRIHFISFGKFSGSYGTSGSDGVGPYLFQPFWGPGGSYISPVQGIRPNFPTNLYNPDYSWALKRSLNLALDLGFFHDRLLLNATYYLDKEGNQLTGYPLPIQTGFGSVAQNVDAMIQNSGWEFTLTSTNIKTKNITWTTNFNITFNRNKLLNFPNLESSSYNNSYVIGKPTSIIIGSRFKGLNPQTGLFEYYTKDGKATNNPMYGLAAQGGDYAPIGDREVKYMGGFTNNFTYKRVSLYVFFQFSSQMAPNWLKSVYSSAPPGSFPANQPVQVLNYWKSPGDQTPIQRLTSAYYGNVASDAAGNFGSSSGAFSDDTYLRLKTLALSYNFSDAALRKLHVHDARIFVNAQNLLTITNYKVGDPETFGDLSTFPLQRILAFGLSFNF